MKFSLLALLVVSTSLWAKDHEVQMKSISFDPKVLDVQTGDTVTWSNVSYTDHSATSESFDTQDVPPKNKSKAITFSKPGKYPYNCKVHGKTMHGLIQVGNK